MLKLQTDIESWELTEVFATSRDAITHIPLIKVTLTDASGLCGVGEAAGVDYDGETPDSMRAQLVSISALLTSSTKPTDLRQLLPAGGARNALDCALWDLRAKQTGIPAHQSAGLATLLPVLTCLTIGLGSEEDTRRKARAARHLPLLKLKLDQERHVDVVRLVREEAPHATLIVDANQAWSRTLLERLLPQLHDSHVKLIEQPVPRGEDESLRGLKSSIPLAADESCTDRYSLDALHDCYQLINIKLDKSGGLTEALALAHAATMAGFKLMIGNMCGTSLGMAPAFLIAQHCLYSDLDGPLLQNADREHPIHYANGVMSPPDPRLWG